MFIMCTSDVGLRLVPEDGYSMPESWEVNNSNYTMFIFALVLGFIIKLRFPKNTSVRDVTNKKLWRQFFSSI